MEVLADPTRPQVAPPRDRYVYYPNAAEVPEAAAVNIRNRSYSIAVEVDVEDADASGVLFSHGARFGGHALYVKDRKLKYVYNFVGCNEQIVESTQRDPDGQGDPRRVVRARGRLDARDRHALALHRRREGRRGPDHDAAGQLLARRRGAQRRQGSRPSRSPTTTPARSPFAFTGGTIKEAVVDVSGEHYVDLELEALAMMKRE